MCFIPMDYNYSHELTINTHSWATQKKSSLNSQLKNTEILYFSNELENKLGIIRRKKYFSIVVIIEQWENCKWIQ